MGDGELRGCLVSRLLCFSFFFFPFGKMPVKFDMELSHDPARTRTLAPRCLSLSRVSTSRTRVKTPSLSLPFFISRLEPKKPKLLVDWETLVYFVSSPKTPDGRKETSRHFEVSLHVFLSTDLRDAISNSRSLPMFLSLSSFPCSFEIALKYLFPSTKVLVQSLCIWFLHSIIDRSADIFRFTIAQGESH